MVISVLRSFVLYILLASLFHTVYLNNIDGCPPIHVQKNRILRTKESLNNGAKFIHREFVQSAKECYKLCCGRGGCNLGMLSYKNSSSVHGEIVRTCYLFDCGSPSKCIFSSYDHYATIEFEDGRSHDKSSKIDQNPKSGSTKAHEENCPLGVPVAMCMNDPCINAVCPGNPLALCKPSFCGSCHAKFYDDDDGKNVNCYARTNEPDNTKNSNEHKWLDSGIFAENDKPHSNTHQKPVHNVQDLESRLHEMTSDNKQSHQSTIASSSRKDKDQHRNSWNNQGSSDGSEHQAPVHTSRGSSSHRNQKPDPTDPPFHEWRKFIDNNPDYPKVKMVTEKPTPKRTPKPTDEKSTEPFHQWREFIDNNPKYDKKIKTSKTQQPTRPHVTTLKTKPATKVGTKIPPKVDNNSASSNRNITDVKVVIETNHLRIVENKAVVPLAIFLVIALLLLIVVGLRLRMMKNRLRRKAFATDDADYLINGMYL